MVPCFLFRQVADTVELYSIMVELQSFMVVMHHINRCAFGHGLFTSKLEVQQSKYIHTSNRVLVQSSLPDVMPFCFWHEDKNLDNMDSIWNTPLMWCKYTHVHIPAWWDSRTLSIVGSKMTAGSVLEARGIVKAIPSSTKKTNAMNGRWLACAWCRTSWSDWATG
ncbi:unnamed protein product [Discosporangium mesarthrocarpum]